MLFDAINLNMGFEGLCPPGLGLPRYAEIAGALMEVLPRLLPDMDSQVTLLVTVVLLDSCSQSLTIHGVRGIRRRVRA